MQKHTPTLVKFGFLFLVAFTTLNAQDATIEATGDDISESLDLEAVASLFGEAENLEEFEQKLNDPDAPLSNLDLNEDGYVDYLRVVETMEDDTHVIALQAVLDEDVYQDVATIEVEQDSQGTTHMQVVGNAYVYGTGYIVEPIFARRPVIFSWLWRPVYRPYRSVYYWGYYPKHFRVWKPFQLARYKKNVLVHVNVKHTYRRVSVRYSTTAVRLHTKVQRNDYAVRYPQRAHSVRVTTIRKTNANGTTKKVATVRKTNSPTKRVVTKETNSRRKGVVVNNNPNGTRTVKAASVKKTTVKKSGTTTKVKKTKITKKKVVKKKKK